VIRAAWVDLNGYMGHFMMVVFDVKPVDVFPEVQVLGVHGVIDSR